MDIYAEIEQRRAERFARRRERAMREKRVRYVTDVVLWLCRNMGTAVLVYACLWLLAFWASI